VVNSLVDQRKQQLIDWLEQLGQNVDQIEPASADASFRRYFRIGSGAASLIVMDAPPAQEDTAPFVRIARRFREIGLNVPEVLEEDREQGFLLLSDLGNRTYLQELNPQTVERLYGDALSALTVLQLGTSGDPHFLPAYDRELLRREMMLFPDWLLEKHLGLELTDEQRRELEQVFELLIANALEQPAVWVHRDYHSRNLMVLPADKTGHNPGILDFQDAVTGPVTYDLVSLLRDCYIDWPREQVESWVKRYQRAALDSGLQVTGDDREFQRWFDLMGVQRHLKASGIFARLYHRDGKPGYLADIPRTIGYIVPLGEDYPELLPLIKLIEALDRATIVSAARAS